MQGKKNKNKLSCWPSLCQHYGISNLLSPSWRPQLTCLVCRITIFGIMMQTSRYHPDPRRHLDWNPPPYSQCRYVYERPNDTSQATAKSLAQSLSILAPGPWITTSFHKVLAHLGYTSFPGRNSAKLPMHKPKYLTWLDTSSPLIYI